MKRILPDGRPYLVFDGERLLDAVWAGAEALRLTERVGNGPTTVIGMNSLRDLTGAPR